MLMMVICQLPSSEGKSIYGSGPAMAVAIDEQHGGSGEPEEGQQQQRGLHLAEKAREGPAAEVADIFDVSLLYIFLITTIDSIKSQFKILNSRRSIRFKSIVVKS